MYQFRTKLEPFGRGFLSCESNSKIKRMAAGLMAAGEELPLEFDLENGFVYAGFQQQATGV